MSPLQQTSAHNSPRNERDSIYKSANDPYRPNVDKAGLEQSIAYEKKLLSNSADSGVGGGPVVKRLNNVALSQSNRSKRSRQSVPPGSVMDTSCRFAQLVFKHINDNDYRALEAMLAQERERINVLAFKESRMYTALSFSAFKNHPQCFKAVYNHAVKYNIAGGEAARDAAKTAVAQGDYTA